MHFCEGDEDDAPKLGTYVGWPPLAILLASLIPHPSRSWMGWPARRWVDNGTLSNFHTRQASHLLVNAQGDGFATNPCTTKEQRHALNSSLGDCGSAVAA